jgi:hypothetical protein
MALVDVHTAFHIRGHGGRGHRVDRDQQVDGDPGGREFFGHANLIVGTPGVADQDERLVKLSRRFLLDKKSLQAPPFLIGDRYRRDLLIEFHRQIIHAGREDPEPAAHAIDVAGPHMFRLARRRDGLGQGRGAAPRDIHTAAE